MTSAPSVKQRIRAARRAVMLHSPTMQGTTNSQIQFIVDPVAAQNAFYQHELLPVTHGNRNRNGNSDEDDDDDASDNDHHEPSNTTTSPPDPPCSYANLCKPIKPTRLLQHALTNANGDAWFRQRYCVSRAFAVPKPMRANCGKYAAEKMIEMIQSQSPSLCGSCLGKRKNDGIKATLDVRYLAREVAAAAMIRMVFGAGYRQQHDMIDALRGMVLDTLELVRNHDDKRIDSIQRTKILDALVREAINDIATDDSSDDANHCLGQRLLDFEKDGREQYYLTRDEVVSNAHSALLAGTQTISTTIAGALAHLAQMPDLQRNMHAGSLSGRAVVMETLRILPPVAGLPRVPKDSGLVLSCQKNGGSASNLQCPVQKEQIMVVDLLAFAHAQPIIDSNDNDSGNGSVSDIASLKFDPRKGKKGEEQPWGIGKRKCPAGIISVECISIILETMIERNFTWKFARPKKDMIDEAACRGWIESIVYRPTLQFNDEIRITFLETFH